MLFKKKIDVVSIGDTATDAFIRIKDAHVHCNLNKNNCELCFGFGDKVPYENVTVVPGVGNSANAAVSFSKLGLRSAFISNVGDDRFGTECMEALEAHGVATRYMSRQKGIPTSYHYILWYDNERTILTHHEDYIYTLPAFPEPQWMYLSSLGSSAKDFHNDISEYLLSHPKVKLAFQPGTFQIKLGAEALKSIYGRTEVFISNLEEAQKILETNESDAKKLINMMQAKGPKIVVITDGPQGAYAGDGVKTYYMPAYPDERPAFERTGAGDAFASALVAFLIKGKTLPEALKLAPIDSASVVQKIGSQAGLLTEKEIYEWLHKAPLDYGPKEI
jgi:sugar/nucleoside kinase (ribokinase family)